MYLPAHGRIHTTLLHNFLCIFLKMDEIVAEPNTDYQKYVSQDSSSHIFLIQYQRILNSVYNLFEYESCNSWCLIYVHLIYFPLFSKWFNLSSLIDISLLSWHRLFSFQPLIHILFAAIMRRPLAYLPLNHMDTHSHTHTHTDPLCIRFERLQIGATSHCYTCTPAAVAAPVYLAPLSLRHLNRKRCTFKGLSGTKVGGVTGEKWKAPNVVATLLGSILASFYRWISVRVCACVCQRVSRCRPCHGWRLA